jgi:hypothetical protein
MSDDRRRLETEEQAERFFRARRRGGECAACGRGLGEVEPVYIERFLDAREHWRNRARGPVGPVGRVCLRPVATRHDEP